jgi:hypothetical protein
MNYGILNKYGPVMIMGEKMESECTSLRYLNGDGVGVPNLRSNTDVESFGVGNSETTHTSSHSNSEYKRAKVLIEKSPLTPLCQRGAGGISFARDVGSRFTCLNANLYQETEAARAVATEEDNPEKDWEDDEEDEEDWDDATEETEEYDYDDDEDDEEDEDDDIDEDEDDDQEEDEDEDDFEEDSDEDESED